MLYFPLTEKKVQTSPKVRIREQIFHYLFSSLSFMLLTPYDFFLLWVRLILNCVRECVWGNINRLIVIDNLVGHFSFLKMSV